MDRKKLIYWLGLILTLLAFANLLDAGTALAQGKRRPKATPQVKASSNAHEVVPFIGFYAPDRFETGLAYGVRYFYRIDARHTAGVLLGVSSAKQDFASKVNLARSTPGSDGVIYHAARLTRDIIMRARVQPYISAQVGLTRIHEEHNMTFGFGVGNKIHYKRNLSVRYEVLAHFFKSGTNNTSWTNKNLEFSLGMGFFL